MTDEYHDYLVEYPFDGSQWGFTIKAKSQEEAEARLKSIPWGDVKGRLGLTIPGWMPAWIVSAYCAVLNLKGRFT